MCINEKKFRSWNVTITYWSHSRIVLVYDKPLLNKVHLFLVTGLIWGLKYFLKMLCKKYQSNLERKNNYATSKILSRPMIVDHFIQCHWNQSCQFQVGWKAHCLGDSKQDEAVCLGSVSQTRPWRILEEPPECVWKNNLVKKGYWLNTYEVKLTAYSWYVIVNF